MTAYDFPIMRRWPPRTPDAIQYYGLPTPNGIKVSVALEELGLPYDAHKVDISDAALDQMTPEFLSLAPNNKIPAILDPQGPEGRPLGLFESGAILVYLADKTGRLLPREGAARYETLQWLMWQMGGVGPMFGQVGFFHRYKGAAWEDKRPRQRYYDETRRLLGVLDRRLAGRAWIMGDAYSIADIATAPWVRTLTTSYQADEALGLAEFAEVIRWRDAFLSRPAVQRGIAVPA